MPLKERPQVAAREPDQGGALKRFSTWLVFDYDGTLRTELPMYAQLAFALDLAAELGHPTSLPELQVGGCLPWPSW